MPDEPLDADLAQLRDLDARIEQILSDSGGSNAEGPRGTARVELDRLVAERSLLLQRINGETPAPE
jgi:hypothetical protein